MTDARQNSSLVEVSAMRWSPDRSILAVGSNERPDSDIFGKTFLNLYSPSTHRWETIHTRTPSDPYEMTIYDGLSWNSEGTRLTAVLTNGEIQHFDALRRTFSESIQTDAIFFSRLDINSSGTRVATAQGSDRIKIYELQSGRQVIEIVGTHYPSWLGWSPNDRQIATADIDDVLRIWSMDDSTLALSVAPVLKKRISAVAWSPDGRRIAVCYADQVLRVWDSTSGVLILETTSTKGNTRQLLWLNTGQMIVLQYTRLKFLDADTGEVLSDTPLPDLYVKQILLQPGDNLLTWAISPVDTLQQLIQLLPSPYPINTTR